jgi:addiction module HigA family antidote
MAMRPKASGRDGQAETLRGKCKEQRLHNAHPGEILKQEFLAEIGISQNQLAQSIGVPGNRIHAIVNGTRDITADTDLRLCKFFGLSEGYFLRLQNAYDSLEAKRRIAAQLAKIEPYKSA